MACFWGGMISLWGGHATPFFLYLRVDIALAGKYAECC